MVAVDVYFVANPWGVLWNYCPNYDGEDLSPTQSHMERQQNINGNAFRGLVVLSAYSNQPWLFYRRLGIACPDFSPYPQYHCHSNNSVIMGESLMNLFVTLLWCLTIILFISWPFIIWYLYTHLDDLYTYIVELDGPPYGLKEGKLELIKRD